MTGFDRHRERFAGLLMALIGAGAIYEGQQYGIGSLTNMGSGFFPVMLGVGMILMGALMALMRPGTVSEGHGGHGIHTPDWRGAAAIVAAVALFIGLADRAGLAPATFACVFVGALGTNSDPTDRGGRAGAERHRVRSRCCSTMGLQVQFPVIRGVMQ